MDPGRSAGARAKGTKIPPQEFFMIIMILISSVKVAMETGSGFALLLGLAMAMGILSGLNKD